MKETVSSTAFVILCDDEIEAVVLHSNTLATKLMNQLSDTDAKERGYRIGTWKLKPTTILDEEDLL